ncbi:MAG: hypothetical protein VB110_07235 [Bacteroidales bacterium]|nr:hypothetical protein [Bacteroidales bacterium]
MATDFYRQIKPALNELIDYEVIDTLSIIRQYIFEINYNGFGIFKKHLGFELDPYISTDLFDFLIVNSVIYSKLYHSINSKTLNDFKCRERLFNKIIPVYKNVFQENGATRSWLYFRGLLDRQDSKRSCRNVFLQIYKCYYTFGNEKVREHIESVIMMSYKDFLNLGHTLYFYYSRPDVVCLSYPISWFKNIPEGFKENFQSDKSIDRIFELLSCDFKSYRSLLKSENKYDNENIFNIQCIAFSKYPLIEIEDRYYCPTPEKILKQITDGIYHLAEIPQLNSAENNIATLIGAGFEIFIGELIKKINFRDRFRQIRELKFGKPEKKTSDWIILDNSSIVFIECKTKRLRNESKSQLDIVNDLKDDLMEIAKGIMKMLLVIDCYEHNKIDDLPYDSSLSIYPVMITFQDYCLNSSEFHDIISGMVKYELDKKGINPGIVDSKSFYIYSASDFEVDFQMMEEFGINEYFELFRDNKIDDLKVDFKSKQIFAEDFVTDFGPGSYNIKK